jgi:spore coat polysaccharide biosynthesis predicted glycosyltransferase SpsG
MNQKRPVFVLIAPLDWGLGHATRCIPIIKELIQQGAQVTIAASGSQNTLLKQEFPLLEFLELPGYKIRYKTGVLLKWALFARVPVLLRKIRNENIWLEKTLENRKIDVVISDNRYGLFNNKLYSVFISHQLLIQSGWTSSVAGDRWSLAFSRWVENKILKWNYKLIMKFSTCWVPDQEGNDSFAGRLSHPPVLPPIPVKYIGILSRFKKTEKNIISNSLLILLSGPEPQRTEFEDILFRQLAGSTLQTTVVRGLPDTYDSVPQIRDAVKIFNHLPSSDLNELMAESEFIIARSGYSTIMDLMKMKRNAILVPTPGQTEQEYLGIYMKERQWMYNIAQKNFNLENALNAFQKMEMHLPEIRDSELHDVVKELLIKVSAGSD